MTVHDLNKKLNDVPGQVVAKWHIKKKLWAALYWQGRASLVGWFDSVLVRRIVIRRPFLIRILAIIMRRAHLRLLMNVVPGLGHNTVELDYFFRLQRLGLISPQDRVVFVRKPNPIHNDTLSLYRGRFWFASASRLLYYLFYLPAAATPDIRIDCGLSRLKWDYDPQRKVERPVGGQTYFHQKSKSENRDANRAYYKVRRETKDYFPLKEGLGADPELIRFLGGLPDRPIASIHVKNHVVNATAAPTDPAAYVETIRWLQARDYIVVHVGREPTPPVFLDMGVLSYANFSGASYRHDLQMFGLSTIAITAGSGISYLADCLGTPLVYLDSWQLGMPMPGLRTVMVPALVRENMTGRMLSFPEQFDLYWKLEDVGAEVFPTDRYQARNASSDEILAAVKEALALVSRTLPLSERQERFGRLDEGGLAAISRARVSDYFLEKHGELFGAIPSSILIRR